jgi:hypothetical protein
MTLPKKWVDRFNLSSGDEVTVEEKDTWLVVSTEAKTSTETTVFDFEGLKNKAMNLLLSAAYKQGLTDITLINLTKTQKKDVQHALSSYIGLEKLDTGPSSMRLVDVSRPAEELIDKAQQQMMWKLLNMFDETINGMKPDDLHQLDMEVNRLSWFLQRSIAVFYARSQELFMMFEEAGILEALGDTLKTYNRNVKTKPKAHKVLLGELKKAVEDLQAFRSKPSMERMLSTRDSIKKIKLKVRGHPLAQIAQTVDDLLESVVALKITELSSA